MDKNYLYSYRSISAGKISKLGLQSIKIVVKKSSELVRHAHVVAVLSVVRTLDHEGPGTAEKVLVFEATDSDGVFARGGVLRDVDVVIAHWNKTHRRKKKGQRQSENRFQLLPECIQYVQCEDMGHCTHSSPCSQCSPCHRWR